MWHIVHDLAGQNGVTIFLTMQYLEEADQLAGRVAVLDQGRLVAESTSAELKQLVPGGHVTLRFTDAAEINLAASARHDQPRFGTRLSVTALGPGSRCG
jgi:ABC-2 type transport system ATP-binding protein